MDKEQLKQIGKLKTEITTLKKQIEGIGDILLMDKVKGSSCHFPYTERSFTIVGVDTSKADRLQRKLNRKIDSLIDLIDEINGYIDNIPDSLTRQIISLRYINNLTWEQVAESIGGNNTEDSVRMICNRFLDKI